MNVKILWCNIAWLFVVSFIPYVTQWVGSYPTSPAPMCLYFSDMALSFVLFHVMYYIVFRDLYPERKFRLRPRSFITLTVFLAAAAFGGLCPSVTYIVVTMVTLWWVIPEKPQK